MNQRQAFLRLMVGGLMLGAVSIATPTCAVAAPRGQVHVYVRTAPPRAVVERRVAAPGPGYVWISGYQRWDGRAYAWVPGRWERPPRHGARWVNSQWKHDRSGYFLVEGHWR